MYVRADWTTVFPAAKYLTSWLARFSTQSRTNLQRFRGRDGCWVELVSCAIFVGLGVLRRLLVVGTQWVALVSKDTSLAAVAALAVLQSRPPRRRTIVIFGSIARKLQNHAKLLIFLFRVSQMSEHTAPGEGKKVSFVMAVMKQILCTHNNQRVTSRPTSNVA